MKPYMTGKAPVIEPYYIQCPDLLSMDMVPIINNEIELAFGFK